MKKYPVSVNFEKWRIAILHLSAEERRTIAFCEASEYEQRLYAMINLL